MEKGIDLGKVYYKEKQYSYSYDGKFISLTPDELEPGFLFLTKEEEKEGSVIGITNTNRSIMFLKLKLRDVGMGVLKSFVPAYIVCRANLIDHFLDFESFESMFFYGDVVNNFYDPQKLLVNTEPDKVVLKSYKDVKKEFVVNNNKTCFGISSARQYSIKKYPLKLESYYQIQFNKKANVEEIIDYYIEVSKFFSFIYKRSHIQFDKIKLQKKILVPPFKPFEQEEKEQLIDCRLYVAPQQNVKIDLPRFIHSLKLGDVEDRFENIYKVINDKNAYLNHYSANSSDDRYIDIDKYLKITASFESWFGMNFPEFKSKKDKIYKDIKGKTIEFLEESKLSGNKKEKKYLDTFIKTINLLEGRLDEKLQHSFNLFSSITENFASKLIEQYELEVKNIKEVFVVYSKKRNKLSHGNISELEFKSEEIIGAIITQKMIRFLSFRKMGFTNEEIAKLFEKEK